MSEVVKAMGEKEERKGLEGYTRFIKGRQVTWEKKKVSRFHTVFARFWGFQKYKKP